MYRSSCWNSALESTAGDIPLTFRALSMRKLDLPRMFRHFLRPCLIPRELELGSKKTVKTTHPRLIENLRSTIVASVARYHRVK